MNKFTHLSFLIKPSSSMCNLSCSYCFYADVSNNRVLKNYGFINEQTTKSIIENAIESTYSNATIEFSFQGGEPTLIGLDFYKEFVNYVNEKKNNRRINYAIQTNGTLLNNEWCEFFKKNNVLVGISIDGFKSNNDYYRYDIQKRGQYEQIIRGLNYLKKYNIDFNVLTVLTSKLSKHPEQLFDFYKSIDVKYIQLIPCLPELENNENDDSLSPKEFYEFYTKFLDLWIKDECRLKISLFDDLIRLFVGNAPVTCGMLGTCSPQIVVEGDGSVFPCDFYVLDENRIGNINTESIPTLMKNKIMNKFLNEPKRISSLCENCQFISICNANCKRMNVVYFDDENYCGYQSLLVDFEDKFNQIAINTLY